MTGTPDMFAPTPAPAQLGTHKNPIDIGEADPPAGCYEITSICDQRRRYIHPDTGLQYIGRARDMS